MFTICQQFTSSVYYHGQDKVINNHIDIRLIITLFGNWFWFGHQINMPCSFFASVFVNK
jgi:hypothetical protein